MKKLIDDITAQLSVCYPEDEARSLAWWVIEESTGLNRSQLLCGCKDTAFSPYMQEIVDRLLHFEPIQYIFGHTLWLDLDLKVTPATLIPRSETAELVERVECEKWKVERLKVLDIGTGSGCIAIALKKLHPEWQITGVDISAEAIEVAKENAERNGVDVNFMQADVFADSFDSIGHFDIVVSNPPYVCESEKKSMRPNVLNFEPATALFVPDDDPLRFYHRIASLHKGDWLFFEINEAYATEMEALMREQGYEQIQITEDIYGKPRVIAGRMA